MLPPHGAWVTEANHGSMVQWICPACSVVAGVDWIRNRNSADIFMSILSAMHKTNIDQRFLDTNSGFL